jgi:putative PIN family toxin of toxin-antitoxin system
MKFIKVVADTNILFSAMFWKGNEAKILKLAEEGEIKLLMSPALLDELRRVLMHEELRLDERTIGENVQYVLSTAELVSPRRMVKVIREDPSDNRVLECALEGSAKYVISGDKHLLRLKKFRGIRIVRAKEFLDILNV